MISSLESNQVGPSSSLPGELHSSLNSLGTRVPEKERIERRVGHDGEESIDELEVWCVESERALEVDELRDLSSGSLRYGWVTAEKSALSLPIL